MFDSDYIESLEDYYRRNECIREQQYLSQEKLLHLAAFCMSKAANTIDASGQSRRNGPKADAALDAVRQLSLLCEKPEREESRREPNIVVSGQSNAELQTGAKHTTTSATPTAEKLNVSLLRLWKAVRTIMSAVTGWLKIRSKSSGP